MEDELKHYGVLGMKWGVHRSNVYAQRSAKRTSRAESYEAKGKTAKASKARTSAAKLQRKATHKANVVKTKQSLNEFSKSRSLGKRLATNMIGGLYANRTYNAMRMQGDSRVMAMGKTIVTGYIGGLPGHLIVSHLKVSDLADRNTKRN